jgi:Mg2+-importing ATPase
MSSAIDQYFLTQETDLLKSLQSSPTGISNEEAEKRLKEFGENKLTSVKRKNLFILLLGQFKNALTIILVSSAILSFFLGQQTDGLIILTIIIISALLGFFQEKGAMDAVQKLLNLVRIQAKVLRENTEYSIPVSEVVPGDIALLSAGDMVPADARLLESRDLFVNEAMLTGETFPLEKKCTALNGATTIAERINSVFMGTNVISGTAKALIVKTGTRTELGAISEHLRQLKPDTEFQKGIRRFGLMLMQVTLILLFIIFTVNIFLHKPILDSFLFSLAIAVGLTPQLLPAIISINLAKGATNMARQRVIVKRLDSIENLGSMNILCSDKTGTLTEGNVTVQKAVNYQGEEDEKIFRLAYINAHFESGFTNPLDEAICKHAELPMDGITKLDELPYDFIRKCLSIAVETPQGKIMITKGAFDQVLSRCSTVEDGGQLSDIRDKKEEIENLVRSYCRDGFRTIAIAHKPLDGQFTRIDRKDEAGMCLAGLLLLSDPPKTDAAKTLLDLKNMGITLKIITGDNEFVAEHLGKEVGISNPVILTGTKLAQMSAEALVGQVGQTDIFASVEPNQKESILLALKKAGNVVGFIGDGINDAPALHIADVGISVNGAVDVAKEAADIVLLGKDLQVLIHGVKEGRKTFANTLKYIFMATSANFGNMFSVAGTSVFLSFLPLLPKQVLFINLLTDIPEMTIASDSVDDYLISAPTRINMSFIRRFMVVFGLISSVFDYLTFAILLFLLKADIDRFRTGWLIESVVSAALIVLVVRTSKSFFKSRPGKFLLLATLSVIVFVIFLPLMPLASVLGLVALPLNYYGWIFLVILAYALAAETAKKFFYKKVRLR